MRGWRRDDSHEFKPLLAEIEEAPLNPLGRVVFWLVITSFVFALLWGFFGRVDVVVSARGKFVPFGEVKVVQPLTTGVVREIRAAVGDHVQKGGVLLEIDPSDTEPELDSRKNELNRLELDIMRLRSLLTDAAFSPDPARFSPEATNDALEMFNAARKRLAGQKKAKTAELLQVKEQLGAAKSSLKRYHGELADNNARLKRLELVRDIISLDEWNQAEKALRESQNAVTETEHKIAELEAGISRIGRELALVDGEQRNRWLEELNDLVARREELSGQIKKAAFYNEKQKLRAPVAGFVSVLAVHTTGGVVTPAEKLVEIVPDNSPLLVRALVMNKDVGFVRPAMRANVKVDAFDFQKYGLIEGKVEKVSRNSVEDKQLGLVYETMIVPERTELMVEGAPRKVSAGMGATVEIKVGRRRVLELFICPAIKYFGEGISVR